MCIYISVKAQTRKKTMLWAKDKSEYFKDYGKKLWRKWINKLEIQTLTYLDSIILLISKINNLAQNVNSNNINLKYIRI